MARASSIAPNPRFSSRRGAPKRQKVVMSESRVERRSAERVERRKLRVEKSGKRFRFLDWSALEELDVLRVEKVPRVHGAVAPGKPLVAAYHFLYQLSGRFGLARLDFWKPKPDDDN